MASSIMTQRVFNFSAGPAVLPLTVLEQAQADLLCLPGVGSSILEISHRSQTFVDIMDSAEANLRELLNIGDEFKILFLQGGSRLQFSMVPMNLLRGGNRTAQYITTGSWGEKSYAEAIKEGDAKVAWDGKQENYNRTPRPDELDIDPNSTYTYITSNETIQGVQFQTEPETGGVPLVSDNSSDFLSRPLDISRYGLIYACAQKNAGPAGVTAVIVREDMLNNVPDGLPSMLDYRNHIKASSMFNTPPTFSIYILKLITDWLLNDIGGLEKMHAHNQAKAKLLYDVIDSSNGFYNPHANTSDRSLMNVTFKLPSDELQAAFIDQTAEIQLLSLKGHRSVGGIRASIYNAMPLEGVQTLANFMSDFCKSNS